MEGETKFLAIFRFLTIDIFLIKVIQLMLASLTVSLSLLWLFQTYLFLERCNVDYFIQYGPSYFIALYVMFCLCSTPFITSITSSSIAQMQSWISTDQIDEDTKKSRRQELTALTVYLVVSVLCGFFCATAFIIPTDQDERFFFGLQLYSLYFPLWKNVLTFVYKLALIPSTYVAIIVPTFQIIHVFIYHKLQIYNLLICLRNLNDIGTDQNQVKQKLQFCIKYHIQICKNLNEVLAAAGSYVFPFQVIVTILLTNIVVYYFRDSLSNQYIRIATLAVMAFFTLAGSTTAGQSVEDMSSDILMVATTVEWYHWNETNKKMYLMLLMNTQKIYKVKYSENVSLNYAMAVEMVKTFFSAISVMFRLNK